MACQGCNTTSKILTGVGFLVGLIGLIVGIVAVLTGAGAVKVEWEASNANPMTISVRQDTGHFGYTIYVADSGTEECKKAYDSLHVRGPGGAPDLRFVGSGLRNLTIDVSVRHSGFNIFIEKDLDDSINCGEAYRQTIATNPNGTRIHHGDWGLYKQCGEEVPPVFRQHNPRLQRLGHLWPTHVEQGPGEEERLLDGTYNLDGPLRMWVVADADFPREAPSLEALCHDVPQAWNNDHKYMTDHEPPLRRLAHFAPSFRDEVKVTGDYEFESSVPMWATDDLKEIGEAVGGIAAAFGIMVAAIIVLIVGCILCCVACCCMDRQVVAVVQQQQPAMIVGTPVHGGV